MDENETRTPEFNRRDFLKGGSTATLMTMLGGVELFAQTKEDSEIDLEDRGPKVKVAVIGLGTRGREILNTLARWPKAEIVAVCDTYPASVRRSASIAPGAVQTEDYRAILNNRDILAVVVATPTHQHKEIVLAALKAGKHVYCEAPLAHTIEDASAIALAAKAAPQLVFQPGLHLRSELNRRELITTFRSGALGQPVMARAQRHKKQSWRASSPKPEREQELNWRLDKMISLGLIGEVVSHQMDQARWFFNQLPVAVSGFGTIALWKDGREVADTVRAVLEFPEGLSMTCDATLANSFDGEYEVYFGSDSAVLLRQGDIWLFKEVDSRLLGWEVYFPKEKFRDETGIVLKVGASKSVPLTEKEIQKDRLKKDPLYCALDAFLRNAQDVETAREEFVQEVGDDDPKALVEHLATKVKRRATPGWLEGFQAAVTAIKANEAVLTGRRIILDPQWYQLG
ncbi:MAG TPA: Gfo/Idh/MocA family oxidoreductase [Candidatus Acidoferrum sp.]|jgi:predicted dehydrogenase|nr:Gfo/Idh/MocA family oxidoreductase [Candidatus Acidoferrum sp.]